MVFAPPHWQAWRSLDLATVYVSIATYMRWDAASDQECCQTILWLYVGRQKPRAVRRSGFFGLSQLGVVNIRVSAC